MMTRVLHCPVVWAMTVGWCAVGLAAAAEAKEPAPQRGRIGERLRQRRAERAPAGETRSVSESHRRSESRTMQVGTEEGGAGAKRTYLLHQPPAQDQPLPLMVVLHGALGSGKIMEALTGFSPVADQEGFVAVYPDGLLGMWQAFDFLNDRERVQVAQRAKHDDVRFLRELIELLVQEKIADPRQVYFTGLSNGGYMSNRMACEMPERIAAIAPVAGTMGADLSRQVTLSTPVPVLYIHGDADKIVGFNGTDAFTKKSFSLGAQGLIDWWVRQNRAAAEPEVSQLEDAKEDGVTVRVCQHPAQKDGSPVVFYRLEGGGHTWPGGHFQPEGLLGKTCRDFSASQTIWEFCAQFSRPEAP